jgi:hypothetical protein
VFYLGQFPELEVEALRHPDAEHMIVLLHRWLGLLFASSRAYRAVGPKPGMASIRVQNGSVLYFDAQIQTEVAAGSGCRTGPRAGGTTCCPEVWDWRSPATERSNRSVTDDSTSSRPSPRGSSCPVQVVVREWPRRGPRGLHRSPPSPNSSPSPFPGPASIPLRSGGASSGPPSGGRGFVRRPCLVATSSVGRW